MSDNYIIELRVDVKNPQADRRSKDWYKLPTIPAGSRFIVTSSFIMKTDSRYGTISVSNVELGKAILANAERVEPKTVREFKYVDADWSFDGDAVLAALLKLGRITRADFVAAGELLNASDSKVEFED